ncbi:MAG: RluA family pseudouridine synthase [Planctomycetes bacterium]|jgi:23S rRNA pseudouridine1911/1915/1917 synthase|nr:RluA family pseudouridine synthase [Planctomycetota bacterium]
MSGVAPAQVLFEDNHCLVLCKPAGLLTQGVTGAAPSLEEAARDYLRTTYDKKGRIYLGIPHRLDRPVSGVVMFAKSSKAAARLAEQFRDRVVQKTYWAILQAEYSARAWAGTAQWSDHMCKIADEARAELVDAGAEGARLAELEIDCLGASPLGMLVEMRPRTGRMHQLRLQSASRGMPIVGDLQYGSTRAFGPESTSSHDRVIALHARCLRFLHPIRYEPVEVVAPLPEYWPTPQ